MKKDFFKRKKIEDAKSTTSKNELSKSLGTLDITIIGVGSIVGGGVFVFTGIVAAKYSGPAIMFSYLIAGLLSFCSALAYIELASMIPSSGVVYTYSYIAFGEIIAWISFFVIFLEFSTAAASATLGCARYLLGFLESVGVNSDTLFFPFTKIEKAKLFALLIIFFLTSVLCLGTNLGKKISFLFFSVKIFVIFLFCFVIGKHFNPVYWENFIPFGIKGIFAGASFLYYSFNGYSLLASTASECKNPQKNLSLGTIGAISIAIILYSAVGIILTGSTHYKNLNMPNILSFVMQLYNYKFFAIVVSFGAFFSILSVIFFNLFALSRILFTVAKDQLIPKFFFKLNKYKIPYIAVCISGLIVILLIFLLDIEKLAKLSSISSLMNAFTIMLIVIKLRIDFPTTKRVFIMPFLKIIALISFCTIIFLLSGEFFDFKNKVFTYHFKVIFGFLLITLCLYCVPSYLNKNFK